MSSHPDVLVIGAGVFGLSVALAAARACLSVRLIDGAGPGAGASGGPVGALVAHGAGRWGPLQELQMQGLSALSGYAEALAAEAERDPGYARCGRVVPLADDAQRARAVADADALNARWGAGSAEVTDRSPCRWIDAPAGVLLDRTGARLTPERWLAAHVAALSARGIRVERAEAQAVGADGAVETASGRLSAGHVVVAAGAASGILLGRHGVGLRRGVPGEAARLAAAPPPEMPVVTLPGLYVVPHGDHVGVGSTTGAEEDLDAVIGRARAMVPGLGTAPVAARWRGVRPRGPGALPLVGALPDRPRILAATGGYRIGFALAHVVGAALVADITEAPGWPEGLPPACRPSASAAT